jgi:hypothetical protein
LVFRRHAKRWRLNFETKHHFELLSSAPAKDLRAFSYAWNDIFQKSRNIGGARHSAETKPLQMSGRRDFPSR